MLTALQLQTSEQKPLQDPISNCLAFIYNFTFHALFIGTFWENLPWRWGENLMLALNVREAGAAGIAAITAT